MVTPCHTHCFNTYFDFKFWSDFELKQKMVSKMSGKEEKSYKIYNNIIIIGFISQLKCNVFLKREIVNNFYYKLR